jgi:DNA (cytosine-5)-methyltransferase 1
MEEGELKAGALFSGIGGFCLGFQEAGIKTVWAVENDPASVMTYEANKKGVRVIKHENQPASIQDVHVDSDNLEPVDVIHAGFPCQSFSKAGERKGFDDPQGRGILFFQIIRLLNEFKDRKPSVLVLENAPNLRHGDGGGWFIVIANEIKKAGYWFRDTNCAELDPFKLTPLPQQRNRLFMVAFSTSHFKNGNFNFPTIKDESKKDLSKYISFSEKKKKAYYLPEDNRYYKMISKEVGEDRCLYHLRKFFVRVKDPNVCPTLTANMGLGGHNVPFIKDGKGRLRKLTEFECLKLQGFPLDFVFPEEVSRIKRYTQIGNSVSVPVAALLAHAVRKKIEMERNYVK